MKKIHIIILALILIVFSGLSIASALRESLTYDEIVHIQEGENAWMHHTFNIDTNNPPVIRELQVVPLILGISHLIPTSQSNIQALPGRIVTIIFGIVLLMAFFYFGKKTFGPGIALFGTLLLDFEPSILGNSHYITQDVGVTLLFFLSFILFLLVLQSPSKKTFLILSVLVGLGLAAKLSFLPYFLLSTFATLFVIKRKKISVFVKNNIFFLLAISLVTLSILWATYFFKSTVIVKERQDANRVSSKLLTYAKNHHNLFLQNVLLFTKNQPVPLGDYLGVVKNNALRSIHPTSCYFYGRLYLSCKWYFMLGNLVLKLPIPLMILFGISLMQILLDKKKREVATPLLVPIGVVLLVASVSRIMPMIRYVLPMYPFIILIAVMGLGFWLQTFWRKAILAVLILWYISATLLSFPHFISYANAFAGSKSHRAFVLIDSNLDWGQSLPDVGQFHKNHPDVQIRLSFSGRDNGNTYGLISNKPYGSYKEPDICAFHTIGRSSHQSITLISITNWYLCGYYKQSQYTKKHIKGQLSDSFLIF